MQLEPRKWIDSPVEAIPGVIGTVRFGSTSTNPKPANLAIQWGKKTCSERGYKAQPFTFLTAAKGTGTAMHFISTPTLS